MVKIPKKYQPNEKALPPLLDPEYEAIRLKTIRDRRKEIRKQNEDVTKARNVYNKIISGKIKWKRQDASIVVLR